LQDQMSERSWGARPPAGSGRAIERALAQDDRKPGTIMTPSARKGSLSRGHGIPIFVPP